MPKIISQESNQNKEIVNLTLLLKEKEQEVRIAKQKAGFFARKHTEALEKLGNRIQIKSKSAPINKNGRKAQIS